jgi:hypothetical protein
MAGGLREHRIQNSEFTSQNSRVRIHESEFRMLSLAGVGSSRRREKKDDEPPSGGVIKDAF